MLLEGRICGCFGNVTFYFLGWCARSGLWYKMIFKKALVPYECLHGLSATTPHPSNVVHFYFLDVYQPAFPLLQVRAIFSFSPHLIHPLALHRHTYCLSPSGRLSADYRSERESPRPHLLPLWQLCSTFGPDWQTGIDRRTLASYIITNISLLLLECSIPSS